MQEVGSLVAGDLTLLEDSKFVGMVSGDLIVAAGVKAVVAGMIGGNLVVEKGAKVTFTGMAAGQVLNRGGSLTGSGLVAGRRRDVA